MPLDCLDSFKLGCGCAGSCNCGRRKIVHDSKGACVPVQPDPFKLYDPHRCYPLGGTKTIGVPIYQLVVENPPDDILRDSSGKPILLDGNLQHIPVAAAPEVGHC